MSNRENHTIPKVIRSAFCAGSLLKVQLRQSANAKTGYVVHCQFDEAPKGYSFAKIWAKRLGISITVRKSQTLGSWETHISIPVELPHTRPPIGLGQIFTLKNPIEGVQGGVRRLNLILGLMGVRNSERIN